MNPSKISAFLSSEAALLFVSTKNRDLWLDPIFWACTEYLLCIPSQSDLPDLTGSLWLMDFWCWTSPGLTILGADQKECGLWGQEWNIRCKVPLPATQTEAHHVIIFSFGSQTRIHNFLDWHGRSCFAFVITVISDVWCLLTVGLALFHNNIMVMFEGFIIETQLISRPNVNLNHFFCQRVPNLQNAFW